MQGLLDTCMTCCPFPIFLRPIETYSYFPSHLNELLTCIYKATSVLPDPMSGPPVALWWTFSILCCNTTNKGKQTQPNNLEMKCQHELHAVNWKIWCYDILWSYLTLVVVGHGWLESQIFKTGAKIISSVYYFMYQLTTHKCFSYGSTISYIPVWWSKSTDTPGQWWDAPQGELQHHLSFWGTNQSKATLYRN